MIKAIIINQIDNRLTVAGCNASQWNAVNCTLSLFVIVQTFAQIRMFADDQSYYYRDIDFTQIAQVQC